MQKLLTFFHQIYIYIFFFFFFFQLLFSKNISIYAIFYNQSFNDTLTNDIVSFEQLGPGYPLILWITLTSLCSVYPQVPPLHILKTGVHVLLLELL